MYKSAQKLVEQGDLYRIQGDEEQAYIMYMRYFGIINAIRSHPEYKKNTIFYKKLCVFDSTAMDKTEQLSNSLENRYKLLGEAEAYEKYLEETNISDHEFSEPEIVNEKKSITCEELFQMIHQQNILILDCRPRDDFLQSSCKYKYCMNVPESICVKG